jgi:hypothetical protein
MPGELRSEVASTTAPDARQAVRAIRDQLGDATSSGVFLFVSSRYDLAALGPAIKDAFVGCGPVVGCTTAGEIGPHGFQKGGITALGLASPDLEIESHVIRQLQAPLESSAAIGRALDASGKASRRNGKRRAAVLMVDGLSLSEERLTYALYRALGDIPIVGGSAGDDLAFQRTHVLHDGELISGAATVTVITTSLPLTTVKLQHYEASDRKLVVTSANLKTRTVFEIDGFPAAEAYAEHVGACVSDLAAGRAAAAPLVRAFHGEHYLRSVRSFNDDGSITFYCALEEGMVLSVGRRSDPIASLRKELDKARARVASPQVVIGFDCILRKLELERLGLCDEAGAVLTERRVVGFNTYGEQTNGLHVNQTFSGLVLGS